MESDMFKCNLCSSSFTNVGHLTRHGYCHSTLRAFVCSFCRVAFKRSDALRKHWKICDVRQLLGEPIPPRKPPGRRKTSCHTCRLTKQACDSNLPCQTCLDRSVLCSYGDTPDSTAGQIQSDEWSYALLADPQSNLLADDDIVWTSPEALYPVQTGQNGILTQALSEMKGNVIAANNATTPVEFLIHFTTSSGLNHSINFLTSREWNNDAPLDSGERQTLSEYTFDEKFTWATVSDTTFQSHVEVSQMRDWPLHPLAQQAMEIRHGLIDAILKRGPSGFDILSQVDFFSPRNLENFLNLFWIHWYPNMPLIHQPTFKCMKAPWELILVLSITGALMSPNSTDLMRAKRWLDIVEDLVFADLSMFSDDSIASSTESYDRLWRKLKILQAGVLTCIVQNWDGNECAQKRIRQTRFVQLVSTARDMGLGSFKHSDIFYARATQDDWYIFAFNEELIRQIFVYILDCVFTIFYNIPPKIALSELDMSLTCSEPCFQAVTANEWLKTIRCFYPIEKPTKRLSIRSAVELLFAGGVEQEDRAVIQALSNLNLSTIISAIHSLIFCQQMSLTFLPTTITEFRNALDRWLWLWKRCKFLHRNSIPFSCGDFSSGIARHAPELHRLAVAKLDLVDSSNSTTRATGNQQSIPALNQNGMGTVLALILQIGETFEST